MKSSPSTRTAIAQPTLKIGLLVCAMLTAGCTTHWDEFRRNPFHDRVCPACNARTIEECHCFKPAPNAGYCDTNWFMIEPMSEEEAAFLEYFETDPGPEHP